MEAVPSSDGSFVCSVCSRVFSSKAGCRLHQRKAHPEEFHAEGAAAAAASAARAWTPALDARLWAEFLAADHLPAPARNARLVASFGRSEYSILQRLTVLRRDPPAFVSAPSAASAPSPPGSPVSVVGAVWTVEEERRLWVEFHRLAKLDLRRPELWRRLAALLGRTAPSVSGRITALRRRGWSPPASVPCASPTPSVSRVSPVGTTSAVRLSPPAVPAASFSLPSPVPVPLTSPVPSPVSSPVTLPVTAPEPALSVPLTSVSPSNTSLPSSSRRKLDAAVAAVAGLRDSSLEPLLCALRAGDLASAESLWLSWFPQRFPVLWRPSRVQPSSSGGARRSRRARRRIRFARLQALWASRRKDAAQAALDGSWRTLGDSDSSVPRAQLCDFWEEVFTSPSTPDSRPVPSFQVADCAALDDPISPEEIKVSLRLMRGSAPGPDRVKADDLSRRLPLALAVVRLVHLLGPPEILLRGRVTFLPKVDSPSAPRDFRPITVCSTILRLFHKILASRWSSFEGVVEDRQFGARPIDGCLCAVGLVSSILRSSADHSRSVACAFLDVSKAFDSVSTDSILRAAEALGAPPAILHHLRVVYASSSAYLPDGRLVSCRRGVRQGDPLSPLLFSAVMREAVLSLDRVPGALNFGGVPVPHVAYADDLALCAATPASLVSMIEAVGHALSASGLTLNPAKSRVLVTRRLGSSGAVFVDANPLQVRENTFPAVSPTETFRYLGVDFGWRGPATVNHRQLLAEALDSLARAPLRPQQRLWVLRNVAAAKYLHQLVLGRVHLNTLLGMDRLLRRAARQALHLPHDTPNALFHAPVAAGGLGLPAPSVQVPLAKQRRFTKLAGFADPALKSAAAEAVEAPVQRACLSAPALEGVFVSSKEEARSRWRDLLHDSVDGRGLRDACPISTSWVREPPLRVPGGLFCRAVATWAGALPCAARAARGRPRDADTSINCRGVCGRPETAQHILQTCAITHGPRVKRHDALCRVLASVLRAAGHSVIREPIVPTSDSFLKPDILVCDRDGSVSAIDVAVTSDGALARAGDEKRRKYGRGAAARAIDAFCRQQFPNCRRVSVLPVILTYRGCFLSSSVSSLKSLGLGEALLKRFSWMVVTDSVSVYNQYFRSTYC